VLDAGSEGTLILNGCQIINAVEVDLAGEFTYNAVSFINCKIVKTHANALRDCKVTVGPLTPADNGVIELDADTDISSIDFTADPGLTDGHAVVINDEGEYDLEGWMFTGFGADESDTACIFNDSGGEVTLNISGGGSTPTVRNGSGATTTIVAGASVVVQGLVAGSRVKIVRMDTSEVLVNSLVSGTSETFSLTYTGGVRVEARNASGTPAYQPWYTIITVGTGQTVTALQVED
jgi:hypothetical protein